MEGLDFLKRKYDLHNAPEVKSAESRTNIRESKTKSEISESILNRIKGLFGIGKPEEKSEKENKNNKHNISQDRIQNYLNRLSEIGKLEKKRTRDIEAIEKILFKKYLLKYADVPESYWELQKRIAREQGFGDITISEMYKREHFSILLQDQEESLHEWISYLSSKDAMYPDWLKYFTMRNVLSMSSYDPDEKAFGKRTKGTTKPFPELNPEALSLVLDAIDAKYERELKDEEKPNHSEEFLKLLEGENFSKMYAFVIEDLKKISEEKPTTTSGHWVKYEAKSNPNELVKSLMGYGTGWCTAGRATAEMQLQYGDFYVYYSEDKLGKPRIPRAAIRMLNKNIGEVRGVAKNQNLDNEITPIVDEKLKEFSDGDIYKKRVEDMMKLTDIYNKNKKGIVLTKEDLFFLYETKNIIEGFGWEKDPRIDEIKGQRNKGEDFAIMYGIPKELVTSDKTQITEKIRVFVGSLGVSDRGKDVFLKMRVVNWSQNHDYEILNNRINPLIFTSGQVNFSGCKFLKRIPAGSVFNRPAIFIDTSIEEIPDRVSFNSVVDFSNSLLKNINSKTIFEGHAVFKKTKIHDIPQNIVFKKGADFTGCLLLHTYPQKMIFDGPMNFSFSGLNTIRQGSVFNDTVNFNNCLHLKSIENNVVFNNTVNFTDCINLENIGRNITFNGDVNFTGCKKLSHLTKEILQIMKKEGKIKGELILK